MDIIRPFISVIDIFIQLVLDDKGLSFIVMFPVTYQFIICINTNIKCVHCAYYCICTIVRVRGLHVHCATVHCTAARENWVDFKGIIQKRI